MGVAVMIDAVVVRGTATRSASWWSPIRSVSLGLLLGLPVGLLAIPVPGGSLSRGAAAFPAVIGLGLDLTALLTRDR